MRFSDSVKIAMASGNATISAAAMGDYLALGLMES